MMLLSIITHAHVYINHVSLVMFREQKSVNCYLGRRLNKL
jgi:hypothetical protein